MEESQGLFIARELVERGFQVTVYDPLAMDTARAELADGVEYAESAQAAADGQDAVVIATPWREFAVLDYDGSGDARPLVVDCWGMLSGHDGIHRVRLGMGPSSWRAVRTKADVEVTVEVGAKAGVGTP